jgi:hypothetical protein
MRCFWSSILEFDFDLKTGSFGSPIGYALGLVVIVMAFLAQGFEIEKAIVLGIVVEVCDC